MDSFALAENAAVLPMCGQKRERKPEEYSRSFAKMMKYSGPIAPSIACAHDNNVCRAGTLTTSEDIAYINKALYSTTDKATQDATLLSYMAINSVQRRRAKVENPTKQRPRDITVTYTVMTKDQERIPVCKASFMSLMGVKKDRLHNIARYWLKHGKPMPECRGGRRFSEDKAVKRQAIRDHIQTFACRASHYAHRGAPGRKYLPADLNVKKMHELFCRQNEEQISYALYYSVFVYDFNLGFGHPSKDVCSICTKFRLKLKYPELLDEEKLREFALFMLHKHNAKRFYEILNDVGDSFTISFDMMQNLVLPKSSITQAFYSRQLYQYVFGVVRHRGRDESQRKEDVHFYTWLENENKKDSNMVASALQHYIGNVAFTELTQCEELRLFSDSCYGPSKNIIMLAMLFALRKDKFKNLRVNYTFPVHGHSLMPPDHVFARLEQEIKNSDTILLPSEYASIMERHGNVYVYEQHWQCYDFKAAVLAHCRSAQSFKMSDAKVLQISSDKVGFKQAYGGDLCYHRLLKRGKKWDDFKPVVVPKVNCVTEEKKRDVLNLLGELGVGDSVRSLYEQALADVGGDVGRQDLEDSCDEE